MAGWVIFERSNDVVSELLVEAACLKAEGVEPYSGAAALDGFLLGLCDELAAQACAAKIFGKVEQLDV